MKSWTTWTATCIILCSIGFMPLHTSAVDNIGGTSPTQAQVKEPTKATASSPDLSSTSTFSSTIDKWQSTLAKEDGFTGWLHAHWNSYPLGPGTHGWAVILTDQGQEVGYMIVHAVDGGGFRLIEYGTGSSPLFSLATLYRSLIQRELIPSTILYDEFVQNETIIKDRLYMDTLTSVWKIALDDETYYLDAKSGELLPLTEDPTPRMAYALSFPSDLSYGTAQTLKRPPVDPYERMPWIEGTPLQVTSLPELKIALEQQGDLTYVTELYDAQVTMPLTVLGYQQWIFGDNYLILEHNGPRYVQLDASLGLGEIYP
ncbi:hypothetical protein ASG89_20015 [Paenibacillus sp. Soil766]|uniref:hypothetical protein n=1 Tax=Paenibacillus sp. Soil766 TaxID=1736404 RepID=UPI00070C3F73|nr:hypothetical protein [Paenibacillus sp. Soil766]KRF06033.1 hypothetical protein ASG89_20015 [Paenibacillus sp. Soil766]